MKNTKGRGLTVSVLFFFIILTALSFFICTFAGNFISKEIIYEYIKQAFRKERRGTEDWRNGGLYDADQSVFPGCDGGRPAYLELGCAA
jgi:hypothetical protein